MNKYWIRFLEVSSLPRVSCFHPLLGHQTQGPFAVQMHCGSRQDSRAKEKRFLTILFESLTSYRALYFRESMYGFVRFTDLIVKRFAPCAKRCGIPSSNPGLKSRTCWNDSNNYKNRMLQLH